MNRNLALDKRLNAYRDDLAAAHLRGEVVAARYADGADRQVVEPCVPLLRDPRPDAPQDTQLLYGETFRVYEEADGWAWGQAALDDYVGYLPVETLSPRLFEPTHTVTALRTFLFPKADLKTRPVRALSLNAKIRVVGAVGDYSELARGGFVYTPHVSPLGQFARDFVAVAEQFLGVPYLWGGRGSLGIDCSGLVQMSLERAGISSLRDTDMQEAALGEALPEPLDIDNLRRGDLVYWKGHVGIMQNPDELLHANAAHMCVASEPLEDAIVRVSRSGSAITSVKRLG